jgi:hypothetical protein
VDSFRLETIGALHPVATQLFVPFAVARLQQQPSEVEAVLTVELRGIPNQATEERLLRLAWDAASVSILPLAVQENPLTEWAALGVACAVIWHFGGLRLHAVAALGDGFDYWVRQETREFGLEVSGTLAGDLEARHRDKRRQLLANPYGADGYVVVVDFSTRRAIFSFHRNDEGAA